MEAASSSERTSFLLLRKFCAKMIRLPGFLAMFHLFHRMEAVKRKRETGLISQSRLALLTGKP
jgi:hypothetical protein